MLAGVCGRSGGQLTIPLANSPDEPLRIAGAAGLMAVVALPLSMGVAILVGVLPAISASTLAAAGLSTPVCRRVQRTVDRRFNRARYDADSAVTAFAARLQDAVDVWLGRERQR